MQTTKQSLQLEYQDGDVLLSDNIIVGRKYLYHRILYELKTVWDYFDYFYLLSKDKLLLNHLSLLGTSTKFRD